MAPHSSTLLGKSMDGGAQQAAVHGVAKSRARLSDFTFAFHFHALEKEMATHSSVLAWRIPGMGEPGGCHLWGHTELDTTEVTQQQQQHEIGWGQSNPLSQATIFEIPTFEQLPQSMATTAVARAIWNLLKVHLQSPPITY